MVMMKIKKKMLLKSDKYLVAQMEYYSTKLILRKLMFLKFFFLSYDFSATFGPFFGINNRFHEISVQFCTFSNENIFE